MSLQQMVKQAKDKARKAQLNDLVSPVGSVTDVYGTSGSLRHTGIFRDENPYLNQLNLASKNQDKDALYELAIQWEADYVNRQMQLEENRAILKEQRDYDDPLSQVARQRAAGINPDLEGSGSGATSSGSQAQLTNPGMADQTGQTKFSNAYDNTALVFEGVNSAANVLSSFSGVFSSIGNTIAQFKLLPSQIAANTAQAGLQDAQAKEIKELLSGKKKSLDLTNALQYIDTVGNLANMIKTDATDEEFAQLVSSAGFSQAEQPGVISAIKQAQTQPGFLANYKNQVLADRQAQAELEKYTSEVFSNLVEEELQLKELGLDFEIQRQSISNKVMRFLSNDPSYAENLADIDRLNAANNATNQELLKEQLNRDFKAYQFGLDNLYRGIKSIEARQSELDGFRQKRGLNSIEELEYNTNRIRLDQLNALGAQELNSMYSILSDAYRQKFYLENNIGYNKDTGGMTSIGSGISDDTIVYGNIAWNDVIRGTYTTQELVNQYSSIILQGLSSGAYVYFGRQIGKQYYGSTRTTTHTGKVGNDGKYYPTDYSVVSSERFVPRK